MKFLIIIPLYNEAEHLILCLESLSHQTYKNYKIIIVNDGSTDNSAELLEKFASENSNFSIIHLKKSLHQPGAKVVRAFNKALETEDINDFDVICKFDADIIFPLNYLYKINEVFKNNSKIGMASGWVSIFQNNKWIYEDICNKNHIRGPIKAYRKQCFVDMKGLRTCLGWDNIDVLLAKMHNWETQCIPNLWVKHLRPTASVYQKEKAKKSGIYYYNLGLSFPLACISALKSAFRNRSISEFFISINSFLRANHQLELSPDEIKFIRKHRWKEIYKKYL